MSLYSPLCDAGGGGNPNMISPFTHSQNCVAFLFDMYRISQVNMRRNIHAMIMHTCI